MGPVLRVAFLHPDSDGLMGQSRYHRELTAALARLPGGGCRVRPVSVSGPRSGRASDLRLPLRAVRRAPAPVQRALMGAVLRSNDVVHRVDVGLPPSPVEVVTVQDLAPLHYADEGVWPQGAAAELHRARLVITPSSFIADEIADRFGVARPTVIPHGTPDDAFAAGPLSASDRRQLGVTAPYVLHCGGVSERKNLAGLAAAWRLLVDRVDDVQLVLAGPYHPRRSALFADQRRVVTLGPADRGTVLGLMAAAAVVVVPSTYEGFGFPVVEAMACGTPVVAAQAASLPEVCGDAALLRPPGGEGLADGLERVLHDELLATGLRAAGRARARQLSWGAAAQAHAAAYQRAV